MTRKELAKLIGISRNTLNTWEKEKPELIKLINLGLHTKSIMEEFEKSLTVYSSIINYDKLKLPKKEVKKS